MSKGVNQFTALPIKERLESYARKEDNGCWIWTAGKNSTGYGVANFDGKSIPAHRASWIVFVGDIPDGMCVCHKCDNPLCINPLHLFIGTHAENMMDMRLKGRRKRIGIGSSNGRAKLSMQEAESIRRERASLSLPELRSKYQVSTSTLYRVFNKETWI